MPSRVFVAITVLLAMGLAGCAGSPSPNNRPDLTSPLPSMGNLDPATATPIALDSARMAAITADLASRGIKDAFTVISSEAVTWPDGALGCPKPGMVYPQVLTPGIKVVVAVGNSRYDYHFGGGTTPILCEK